MKNWKNPIEHHSFLELLEKNEMEAEFSGNKVRRVEFKFKAFDYRKWEVVKRTWVCIDLIEKTSRLEELGQRKGLLKVDRQYLCTSCLTSEYVTIKKVENGNTPTCQRCGRIYKGWE